MDDSKIIELYFERSERAIDETDKKYNRYCYSISYNILASNEDANETVNDTYLKVWNTVPPNKPNPLKAYLGMISRQLSINKYLRKKAIKRSGETGLSLDELAECISSGDSGQDIGESLALSDSINRFLSKLPKATRQVFIRRYFYVSSIREIAQDYNMSESAVTTLLSRTRSKLRVFLEKEGYFI